MIINYTTGPVTRETVRLLSTAACPVAFARNAALLRHATRWRHGAVPSRRRATCSRKPVRSVPVGWQQAKRMARHRSRQGNSNSLARSVREFCSVCGAFILPLYSRHTRECRTWKFSAFPALLGIPPWQLRFNLTVYRTSVLSDCVLFILSVR